MKRPPISTSSPATWAAVLGLLTAAAAATVGCSTGDCAPEVFAEGDPCFGKDGCDMVPVDEDAGPVADGGEVPTRFCGCCNG